ncbi:MAG: HNH endonuclease [Raineya sp.]|jgi:hypothetical protein|nr:HNH endonuclease [Raineya sp.]
MIPITHPNLNELAQKHWEAIKNYVEQINKLENINIKIKQAFPDYNFEKLILAKPSEIRFLASQGQNKSFFPKSYYNYLSLSDKFFIIENQEKISYTSKVLIDALNLSVCPYCNRNFIKSTSTHRIDELDHFFPKQKYPFLALSFYNLIPSCKVCNKLKVEEPVSINPYDIEFSKEKFSFRLKIKKASFYHDSENGFEIDFTEVKNKLQENFKIFKIEDLYNQHKDIVLELIQKQITYSDDYIDDLFRRYEGTLFKNREDVLRHIGGSYISEEDFHKRPLSKLTHDMAQELGLL